ncbi:putative calcitonin gene-related peptide type 1 receptor-like, partial [Penaeus vannamei]
MGHHHKLVSDVVYGVEGWAWGCWIEESHYTFILSAPVCVSILANLVFLVNIVRVLVTKLRANHVAADTNGTRKAVRATLILIPLLGLHYVLMPFRPAKGSHWEFVYEVISAVVSSFQGFCVALLFCFCNSEVVMAVKKKWYQYQFMHDHRRFSFTSACIMSVNGVHGKGTQDAKRPSPYRSTFHHSPRQEATVGCLLPLAARKRVEATGRPQATEPSCWRATAQSSRAQRCTNPSETAGLVVVEVLPPEGSGAKGKGGKGAGKGDAIEMKAITPAVVLTTHVHDED